MIDVIHTKQGKSFTGLVAYLMEGSKGAENPERVDWTATRNLATSRPKLAAKVMAATALDQARLKQKAGISNKGRKSNNHVLHYTLSWPAGQEVPRDEMMEAVDGSLAVLGEKAGQKGGRKGKQGRVALRDHFASEHQVLIVAHRDSDSAHCHVVVNRVHPEHGVMLPTSRDFLKLSKWAERFEREHGGLVVDQRALNNEARDKGEKVYDQKRPPRDVYELEQHARENHPEALAIREEQRAKDAGLAKRSAETRARCKGEWVALEGTHKERVKELEEATAKEINTEHRAIQLGFAEKRKELHFRQRNELEEFEKNEEHLLGRASNVISSLVSLSGGVNVLWSKGAREEAFARKQRRQKLELERAERKAKREAKARIRAAELAKRTDLADRYRIERVETILRHQMEKAALRSAWKTRQAQRQQAWEEHHQRMAQRPPEQSFGRQTVVADEKTEKAIDDYKTLKERRAERQRGRDDTERGR